MPPGFCSIFPQCECDRPCFKVPSSANWSFEIEQRRTNRKCGKLMDLTVDFFFYSVRVCWIIASEIKIRMCKIEIQIFVQLFAPNQLNQSCSGELDQLLLIIWSNRTINHGVSRAIPAHLSVVELSIPNAMSVIKLYNWHFYDDWLLRRKKAMQCTELNSKKKLKQKKVKTQPTKLLPICQTVCISFGRRYEWKKLFPTITFDINKMQ